MSERKSEKVMSMLDHLAELRRRLLASLLAFLICFTLAIVFYEHIIGLFTVLFRDIESELGAKLFANTIAEGFLVQLQTAAEVSLLASLPVHLVNLAQFLFPALEKRTRAIVKVGLVAGFLLALLGAGICYFYIVPWSIRFLAGAAFIPRGVGILLNFKESVSYILSFMLWTVVTFQTPLMLVMLLAMNVLKRKAVFRAGRFVVVVIFVISAIVTPSVDPISQCAIALPLVALFFLALLAAKIFRLGEGERSETAKKGGD